MAVKRVVSTSFWTDSKVDMFSPEDKYFMLYLLTNPHTTQLGIYELPKKHAAFELGYSQESVSVLLDRFETKYGIIKRSRKTSEIAIKNYLKHSVVKGGKPVLDCLNKELNEVKDLSLVRFVCDANRNNGNATVHEFIENTVSQYLNDKDNDNDNDNERIVYESYPESSEPRKPKKERKKPDGSFDKIIEDYSSDEEVRSLLREWLKIRKLKRAPLTDRALSMNLNKLDAMAQESGMSVTEYLQEVVERGWAAFYAIRRNGNSQSFTKPPERRKQAYEYYSTGDNPDAF